MDYLEAGCRAALAFVFLIACTSKIYSGRSYRDFHASLTSLGLPRAVPLRVLSLGIPAAEGATVLLLAITVTNWWGLLAAAVLTASFTAGIAIARARGQAVRCRCFGESAAPAASAHILRNLVLLAGAVTGGAAALAAGNLTAGGLATGAGSLRAGPAVFAIGLGIVAAALFLRWDELSFLFTPRPRAGRGTTLRSIP